MHFDQTKPNYNIKAVLYFEPEVRNSEFSRNLSAKLPHLESRGNRVPAARINLQQKL